MSVGIYSPEFLRHIFYGHIRTKRKSKGKGKGKKNKRTASGVHYVGANVVTARSVRVLEVSSSPLDHNGVRLAVVEVNRNGIRARKQSTLFPPDWTRAQVLAAIREVYAMRPPYHRRPYWGAMTSAGVHVTLMFNEAGQIVSAWPERLNAKTLARMARECMHGRG